MNFIANRYKIIDDYDVIDMNKYYKAIDLYENKDVYVKLMEHSKYILEDFSSNLIDERTNISQIESNQIMKILDTGFHYTEYDMFYYVVTDYFEGVLLSDLIKGNYIHLEGAINICTQIVKTLDIARSNDVYHGDLKPSAIFVDKDYNIKISDFGFTKANHGINMRNCSDIRYLCPHQICINYTDYESDYFALGLILFECIFKKLPFEEIYSEAKRLKEIDKGVNWIEIRAINGNEALIKVIRKLLSRSDKYKNSQEIIIDLSDIMYDKANITTENNELIIDNKSTYSKKKSGFKYTSKILIATITFIVIIVSILG